MTDTTVDDMAIITQAEENMRKELILRLEKMKAEYEAMSTAIASAITRLER